MSDKKELQQILGCLREANSCNYKVAVGSPSTKVIAISADLEHKLDQLRNEIRDEIENLEVKKGKEKRGERIDISIKEFTKNIKLKDTEWDYEPDRFREPPQGCIMDQTHITMLCNRKDFPEQINISDLNVYEKPKIGYTHHGDFTYYKFGENFIIKEWVDAILKQMKNPKLLEKNEPHPLVIQGEDYIAAIAPRMEIEEDEYEQFDVLEHDCNHSSVAELKQMCRSKGIRGYSKLKKSELVKKCCIE